MLLCEWIVIWIKLIWIGMDARSGARAGGWRLAIYDAFLFQVVRK